nr:hypothetical protein [uncultured Desulfobulbus sp.]
MSVIGIGSSLNGYPITQMMSNMQTRGPSENGGASAAKEKPDMAQLISKLDTDSSGSLDTSTEIQSLADTITGVTGVSDDLSEFLSTYDSDGDGSLSEEEALSALEANAPQGPPPPGGGMGSFEEDFVKALDSAASGTLDSDDVSKIVDFINEATGADLNTEDVITEYDEDGDGSLSTDDAVAAMEANRPEGGAPPPPPGGMGSFEEELVSSLDANGDGTISADEAEGIVSFINEATGSSLEADDFVTDYDEDGDGSFTTDEAVAAMEDNRPEGAPPSEGSNLTAVAMETYMAMSAMGASNTGDLFTMMLGDAQVSINQTA